MCLIRTRPKTSTLTSWALKSRLTNRCPTASAALLKKGMFGPGAFQTADCRKTFEELKSKGVEFVSEPKDQFYGVEAVFKDPFGNWFSLTQRKNY